MQQRSANPPAGSFAALVVTAAVCVAAVCASPSRAAAQAEVAIGPFGSHTLGDVSSRAVAGIGVAVTSGVLGARVSAGVPVAPYAAQGSAREAWSGDADALLLLPMLASRPLGSGSVPAVFALAGVGAASPPSVDGASRVVGSWSYGGGVTLPLARSLEVTAEGRYRRPFVADALAGDGTGAHTELRVGVAIRLGGRATSGPAAGGGSRTPTGRTSGAGTRPFPPASSAALVLPTAERYLGVPYRWGGTSPVTGFDCSGYVQYVFAKHGTRLPRTSREQAHAGMGLPTDWGALLPGDLVMFAEPGERISHVAIYAGSRRIIHATASGSRVRYDDLDTSRGRWFTRRLVAARRVTANGNALVRDLLAGQPLDVLRTAELDPPDGAPRP